MAHILVIEDEAPIRRSVATILRSAGHDVVLAADGLEGARLARELQPDLVVCDIMLPGQDGYAVLAELQRTSSTRGISFLFLTARADREDLRRGMALGADDYLTKPFEFEELLSAVDARLRRRRSMHEGLERQLEELRQLSVSKDKFLSMIAHDLKGSFTGLLGASRLLVEQDQELAPEQTRRLAAIVSTSAQASYQLLVDLLDWSRLQIGAMECELTILEPRRLAVQAIESLKANADQKHLGVHNRIAEDLRILADRQMIYSVLHNLLSNALKFTPERGVVTLESEVHGEGVTIHVKDTGVGIAAADLGVLFDPARHRHRKGTDGEPGTGLGLLLCKELLEKNGGTLAVESAPGEGTRVSFTLALAPSGD